MTFFARFAAAVTLAGLVGCASTPGRTLEKDPWEKFNRAMFRFNDGADRVAIKPVAKAYKKVTPTWFRTGVGNFFSNVEQPFSAVNQLLQGKPKHSALGACRFVVNTVFGAVGLFDVAGKMGIPLENEDFGQTLAVWGVPSGPFLVLPLLGPSSVRDAPAKVADYYGSPLRYVGLSTVEQLGIQALGGADARARLLDTTDPTLDSAYDRYGLVRSAWVQRREYMIFDGNPPEQPLEDLSEDPAPADGAPSK